MPFRWLNWLTPPRFFAIVGCIIAVVIAGNIGIQVVTKDTITITVTGKEHISDPEFNQSDFYVWATVIDEKTGDRQKETFKVTGSRVYTKFTASNTYGEMIIGETYVAKVTGLGWKPFDLRNILTVDPPSTT
ncbi:MAG: hypothetical protein MK052_02530 [Alphaproteobacteria bacterium]|nr:hypothetical protein [Alphaproteobacteria bacterium]